MINSSLDELRLIAQCKNISDIKTNLRRIRKKPLANQPETKLKPKLKSEQKSKPKPEPKIEIKVNRKKLKKLRKDFGELRHKFSKKDEIREYRKAFYDAKKYKLCESEIDKTNRNLTKLKKSLTFKTFRGNVDSVDYENLDNYDDIYDFADDDKYRKIGSIRALSKEIDGDYYKPIRTNGGFAGKNHNYIEYTSEGDRYENLSPKEYLNMIRPYLRDLINEHIPTMEFINTDNTNNGNNNANNGNNSNNNNNNNNNRAEWKIQLTMQNSCISTRSFEETRTIYTKSEPLEIFMGSDTEDVIDKLFNTLLQRFQLAQETSNERGK